MNPEIIALIPARAGSKRVKSKNIRLLQGHPLLAYTISAAAESGIFSAVVVSTDSEEIATIARHYGAEVPFLRPTQYAGDLSPDIEWVEYTLRALAAQGRSYGCFSILRPTSPFRQAETIKRAWDQFLSRTDFDSLRAVELCSQHPCKMWVVINNDQIVPLLPCGPADPPWHSTPYQALPEVYVQNASLEIAWTRVVLERRTIAGDKIMPFFTEGWEGFDINDELDWALAEHLVASGKAMLPDVEQEAFGGQR
ncbi:MAG: acylneuraminate cytidylyltransferase family protein [Bacillota bacterium]